MFIHRFWQVEPRLLRLLGLVLLTVFVPVTLSLLTPRAAHAATTNYFCGPSLVSGGAFPYIGYDANPDPYVCQYIHDFWWGFTVSGSPTGKAEWDYPANGQTCSVEAYIPATYSNDPNAQYFLFDGSRYLANDAFVNQGNYYDQWVNVSNNTAWYVSGTMRVTLTDQNPLGQANWYIAAGAMRFICSPVR